MRWLQRMVLSSEERFSWWGSDILELLWLLTYLEWRLELSLYFLLYIIMDCS